MIPRLARGRAEATGIRRCLTRQLCSAAVAKALIVTAFPDLRFHLRNLTVDDLVALLEARLTGTNTGPSPPTRPNAWCSEPEPRRWQRLDVPQTSAARSSSRPPAVGTRRAALLALVDTLVRLGLISHLRPSRPDSAGHLPAEISPGDRPSRSPTPDG
jgi:hypothetical protein